MAKDFFAAALRSAIKVTSSIFEDKSNKMTSTSQYKSVYHKSGKTVYENGLIKKFDTKNNLLSVERDPEQVTQPSTKEPEKKKETVKSSSTHYSDGYNKRTVYEKGLKTDYDGSSIISCSFKLEDFDIIQLNEKTKKVEIQYGWIREYDEKGNFITSTRDPKSLGENYYTNRNYSSLGGSYSGYSAGEWINGKYISYADDPDYPKYDPKIPWQERESQMKAFREKKAKERKLEKIRQKKDSPSLLSDMVRELKIDNKDKKIEGPAELHIKWQQFLDYHRRTKVPRVKKRIEKFNQTYKGKYEAHLCNACAGCLIIPTVSEEGYIYNSQRCGSCNGNGFQIPLIRVGEPA